MIEAIKQGWNLDFFKRRVEERILSPVDKLRRNVRVAADSETRRILDQIEFPYPQNTFLKGQLPETEAFAQTAEKIAQTSIGLKELINLTTFSSEPDNMGYSGLEYVFFFLPETENNRN